MPTVQRTGSESQTDASASIAAADGFLESFEQESVNNNLKGRFSRRWTHNEQLFVRCCGVIISRATFYGSEGVSGVKVSTIMFSLLFLEGFIKY